MVDLRLASQKVRGAITLREIRQQAELWRTTLERTASLPFRGELKRRTAIVCGAGSSAYAAFSVAQAWSGARAIPTTDLLVQSKEEVTRSCPGFAQCGALVSLARSGESPESVGVVKRFRKLFPEAMQLAITCNKEGQLARLARTR